MKVAFLTSECEPFVKTGGLADVSSALPKALFNLDCDIRIFLPLYKQIDRKEHHIEKVKNFKEEEIYIKNIAHKFNLYQTELNRLKIYFVECPDYYNRDTIYTTDADEDERYIFFQYAALKSLELINFKPDIIHCNDWQTALIPEILNVHFRAKDFYKNIRTLLTIHNLAYQGNFKFETVTKAGLPVEKFFPGGPYELYNNFNFLKTGIVYADAINTVSEEYSKEILSKDYGAGLEGVLNTRKDDLTGILNGIDVTEWNPEADDFLQQHYNSEDLPIKRILKLDLLHQCFLDENENDLAIGIVSRFAWQKGFDILESIIDDLMSRPLKFIILGDGDKKDKEFFEKTQEFYPDKLFLYYGYNNKLAHLITAGCDAILMPSRYEPCGLNQMYALRYGTLPIVRKTGGLADTVTDIEENENNGNGFVFEKFVPGELLKKIDKALDIYINDKQKWRQMQKRGMSMDFTWDSSAEKYYRLYNRIISKGKA